MRITRCVLSGSYRREPVALEREYRELVAHGCQVLSPHRLNFTNQQDAFVKDEGETLMSADEIERHHLLSLRQADFLWLHCPNGYIGVSTAMEIGYALSLQLPVFCKTKPQEAVFSQFITIVPSVCMAIEERYQ